MAHAWHLIQQVAQAKMTIGCLLILIDVRGGVEKVVRIVDRVGTTVAILVEAALH